MTENVESKLVVWDFIYFLEWDTIQHQKILSERMRYKIVNSWLIYTKNLDVVEKALKNKLTSDLENYVQSQLSKFRS